MDYFTILNFKKEPFANSPDPEVFFQSSQHLGCLQKLELSIRMRRGLSVVIGEVGTGKTTICRQLIRKFANDDRIEPHLVLDPLFSNSTEFLNTVAEMFGARPKGSPSDWQLKESIKNYLFQRGVDEGKTVLLIIDEGQKIPDFCLEILREFLNYETNEYKLLQIVIFAQKEFEKRIDALKNFADRINLYYSLGPLSFQETRAMIQFRLDLAGGDDKRIFPLFSLPALWVIYQITNGYPRKIINLCHSIILTLIVQNRSRAGWQVALACAKKLFPGQVMAWQWTRLGALAAVLVVVFLFSFGPGQLLLPGRLNGQDTTSVQDVSSVKSINDGKLVNEAIEVDESATIKAKTATPAIPDKGSEDQRIASAMSSKAVIAMAPDKKSAEEKQVSRVEGLVKQVGRVAGSPGLLGEVTVINRETMGELIRNIYGPYSFNPENVKAVLMANPQIADPDFVVAGDVISFPVIPMKPLPEKVFWVQLASKESLEGAYRFFRNNQDMVPRMLIMPGYDGDDGLSFVILLEEYFDDQESAGRYLQDLPATIGAEATILAGLDKNRSFFQEKDKAGK